MLSINVHIDLKVLVLSQSISATLSSPAKATSLGQSIRQMFPFIFTFVESRRKQCGASTGDLSLSRHALHLPAKRKAWSHILSFSLSVDIVDTPEKFEAPEIVRVRFLPLGGISHVLGSTTDTLSIESIDS